jgi:hypothetical protein
MDKHLIPDYEGPERWDLFVKGGGDAPESGKYW